MTGAQERFLGQTGAHQLGSSLLVLLTLAVGILIGTVISYGVRGQDKQHLRRRNAAHCPAPKQLSTTFWQIAKQLEPAVVNINTESTIKNPHRRTAPGSPGSGGRGRATPVPPQGPDDDPQSGDDNPFQDFFDRFFGGQGGPNGGDIRQRSLGSGVIVDPKGYIITNRHVVEKADRIRVKLKDDPPAICGHEAKVIGVDEESDLAVIKIDINKSLPTAKLGNSDRSGSWRLGHGHRQPVRSRAYRYRRHHLCQGTHNIVTTGNSSLHSNRRSHQPRQLRWSACQHGCQVIGINTAIITGGQAYEGVGFALPSNLVAKVYNDLIGPTTKSAADPLASPSR